MTTDGRPQEMVAALREAARRFDAVARLVQDPTMRVHRSIWTTSELVAHVAVMVDVYARYLEGDRSAALDLSDVAGGSIITSNAAVLAAEPERDIATLLERRATRFEDLLAQAALRSLDDPVPWHGREVALGTLLALSLGELLVHGRDLARTIGAPWPISRQDAHLVTEGMTLIMPLAVNPVTTRDLVADICVRIRGGKPIAISIDRGTLSVDRDPRRFDLTVSADPVSFLLVAYGRETHWHELARGGLLVWGRRPWLALKFATYFVAP